MINGHCVMYVMRVGINPRPFQRRTKYSYTNSNFNKISHVPHTTSGSSRHRHIVQVDPPPRFEDFNCYSKMQIYMCGVVCVCRVYPLNMAIYLKYYKYSTMCITSINNLYNHIFC